MSVVGQLFQNFDIGRLDVICRFYITSRPIGYFILELTIHTDMLDERQIIRLAQFQVVIAKSWGNMDDTGTILGGHEFCAVYLETILPIF